MINIRTILKLKENDGLTLRNGKIHRYRTGWQVADEGVETTSAREAIKAVKAFEGNCGVWLEKGVYYIDHSFRVSTKHEALAIGKAHNQISIYGWSKGILAYC